MASLGLCAGHGTAYALQLRDTNRDIKCLRSTTSCIRRCLGSLGVARSSGSCPPRRLQLKCAASSGRGQVQPYGKGPGPLVGSSNGGNGVYLLMLLCCAAFLADNLLHLPGTAAMHLNHARPQWWQFLSHLFCHADWSHLSGNLFNLCVFGKMVEETEGAVGVVAAFLVCGVGAALATFLLTPATVNGQVTVSVGASGAIFGLFAVSVATRLRWNLKQLLEAAVLGQFVVRQVLAEAGHQVAGGLRLGGLAVSHAAHLAGAAVGVALVLLLRSLPEPQSGAGGQQQ
ncbi:hypothetical protein Agub_g7489 [Astrephomene gubernaculifera]|uniref:Peptidase S54 rhomboid domain-containing protein n=1 Tax=Astrephomene gubernaculifera TaxID=47775 RepID=A0AAD3HMG7_9CHLO|nr:hypothetical protein Agub_g7489 [Astrephomene gubernaculifera]